MKLTDEELADIHEQIHAAPFREDSIWGVAARLLAEVRESRAAPRDHDPEADRFLDPRLTTEEEVDAALRTAGGDPDAIGKRGSELGAKLLVARAREEGRREGIEEAAQHVAEGFVLIPAAAQWADKRRLLAESVRSLAGSLGGARGASKDEEG